MGAALAAPVFRFFPLDDAIGFLAGVVLDEPRTTSDWPGKIKARRRPFARIKAAVVVWYFLAIPPSVSPDLTTCVRDDREDG
jgi:hypothetical protein